MIMSKSLFLRSAGFAFLTTLVIFQQAVHGFTGSQYVLDTEYAGVNFFDGWDFFEGGDPTGGFTTYYSRSSAQLAGLINASSAAPAYMGVDYVNKLPVSSAGQADGAGRPSVRIATQRSWTHGVFIGDFNHAPSGICGTWPAFWTLGPNWPSTGELDIMEGVNQQVSNGVALHTNETCFVSGDPTMQTGIQGSTNCAYYPDYNVGCGVSDSRATSYSQFNSIGGGVYAMQWTSEFIRVWFFPRGSIPQDITNKQPNPSNWGLPTANLMGNCSIDQHVQQHKVIFDTTFCGSYAGQPGQWNSTVNSCAIGTGYATCDAYVGNEPQVFREAYWSINSVSVYQLVDPALPVPAPQYIASQQPPNPADQSPTPAPPAPSPTASLCPTYNFTTIQTSGLTYEVECDFDLPGPDIPPPYPGYPITSFEDCVAGCTYYNTINGTNRCGGVSYDSSIPFCYFKKYIDAPPRYRPGFDGARLIFYGYPQITDDPRSPPSATSTPFVEIIPTPQYYRPLVATTTSTTTSSPIIAPTSSSTTTVAIPTVIAPPQGTSTSTDTSVLPTVGPGTPTVSITTTTPVLVSTGATTSSSESVIVSPTLVLPTSSLPLTTSQVTTILTTTTIAAPSSSPSTTISSLTTAGTVSSSSTTISVPSTSFPTVSLPSVSVIPSTSIVSVTTPTVLLPTTTTTTTKTTTTDTTIATSPLLSISTSTSVLASTTIVAVSPIVSSTGSTTAVVVIPTTTKASISLSLSTTRSTTAVVVLPTTKASTSLPPSTTSPTTPVSSSAANMASPSLQTTSSSSVTILTSITSVPSTLQNVNPTTSIVIITTTTAVSPSPSSGSLTTSNTISTSNSAIASPSSYSSPTPTIVASGTSLSIPMTTTQSSYTNTISTPHPSDIGNFRNLGCQQIGGSLLNRNLFTLIQTSPTMMPSQCISRCSNSYYIGVHGSECYCVNALLTDQDLIPQPDSACDISCPGSPAERCGGNDPSGYLILLNMFYNTGVSTPVTTSPTDTTTVILTSVTQMSNPITYSITGTNTLTVTTIVTTWCDYCQQCPGYQTTLSTTITVPCPITEPHQDQRPPEVTVPMMTTTRSCNCGATGAPSSTIYTVPCTTQIAALTSAAQNIINSMGQAPGNNSFAPAAAGAEAGAHASAAIGNIPAGSSTYPSNSTGQTATPGGGNDTWSAAPPLVPAPTRSGTGFILPSSFTGDAASIDIGTGKLISASLILVVEVILALIFMI